MNLSDRTPLVDKAQMFAPAEDSHVRRRWAELGRARPEHPLAVLVVDNYDSFTFNLVQYLLELGAKVDVITNDGADAETILASAATHLLLSPGPGRPADSGVCLELCRRAFDAATTRPLLGVCLGHQTLCEVHGATVRRAPRIMHGKVSDIAHDQSGPFAGIPSPCVATRYHSLIVDEATLPAFLLPIAWTSERELMAVRHAALPVWGVQFHPESILSAQGMAMLANFLAVPAPSPFPPRGLT